MGQIATSYNEVTQFLSGLELRFIDLTSPVPDDGIPTFSAIGNDLEFVEMPDGSESVSGEIAARNKAGENLLELHQLALQMRDQPVYYGVRAWWLMESLRSRSRFVSLDMNVYAV